MPDQNNPENTTLTPIDEILYQRWKQAQGNPGTDNYDMKGFYKSGQPHQPGDHFPDTFKQHGHETFSQESKYSKGPWDGGMWVGPEGPDVNGVDRQKFLAQPAMRVSHEHPEKPQREAPMPSHQVGKSASNPAPDLMGALIARAMRKGQ